AHVLAADLADPGTPQRIFAEARKHFERLDVLVNNAAIVGPLGNFWETDAAEWKRALAVDLLAPLDLCRLAVPWMRDARAGSIINVSGGGATTPSPAFSAYGTAKAALVRFSETLAQEVAGDGIRVNCVAPGLMRTALVDEILAAGPERLGEKEFRRITSQVASSAVPPERAARLCVFLASSESAGINGKIISAVWDPWESLAAHADDLRDSDIYTLRRITPEDRGRNWPRHS
ncbi:MAG TPA: SDR family oxidoreductase, partial [Bryobacteraceae bacterium]|nr:SDR family oxidoreductase [Bryobacteraceae bacterium]